MQALVTGATGFVGSHVAEHLLRRGYAVRCLTRATSSLRWLEKLDVRRVEGSLSDAESLRPAVRDADLIVHCAGLTAARDEAEFMRGNRDGTRNLLDAVRRENPPLKRFLHVSSMAVAGPATSLDTPRREDMPNDPITTYGRSKKAAEEVVTATDDIPWTIVRPPAVYGPRDTAILSFFQTVNKGLVPLIGFDEKYVSLVYVDDLARGIIDAAESDNTRGRIYYVSSDEFYTWPQIGNVAAAALGRDSFRTLRLPHPLVKTIAGISGFFGRFAKKPPVLDFEKGRDIVQTYWICSTEKARRDFGYNQQWSLEDGIAATAKFYRDADWL